MNVKLAASMLSADFTNLGHHLKEVEQSGVDYLHLDIMDGHFVPNITFGPDQVAQLRKVLSIPFDTHLMISQPLNYIEAFADAGSDLITIHLESEGDSQEAIDLIKSKGVKAGLVVSPDTPIECLRPFLDDIKMILIMCVYPGFGGQAYLPKSTERIKACRQMIGDRDIDLQVDGGINFTTLETVVKAGANVVVSGSCLFNENIGANVEAFRKIIKNI